MRSTAFEHIDDPNDPAWAGHAPTLVDERRLARHRRTVAVVGVLLVVAVVVGIVVVGSRGSEREPSSRDEPLVDSRIRPSAVVASGGDVASAPSAIPSVPATATASAAADAPRAARPVTPASSGWAPAAATVAPQDAGSGLLEGDLVGVAPELIRRLDALAVASGREIEVVSGWRTRHEQEGLYQSFLSGAGNLAAVPGTSNHETGRAADVYVDGVALASVDGMSARAASLGLHFPVPGEAWHVEMLG